MKNFLMQAARNTLHALKRLNDEKKYIKETEIIEETENIEKIIELIYSLQCTLQSLEECSPKDKQKLLELLLQLHHIYIDFIWHFCQIDDLIREMIRQENMSEDILREE